MKSHKTLIIAEAGVNHNGSLDLALKLVDAASDAGADIVKFQTFKADNLVSQFAPKANYQLLKTEKNESQLVMLRKLELSDEMHQIIVERCKNKNIRFASTGFDEESINLLVGLGVPFLKIPSGEITNFPLLKLIGSQGLPIFLSTGMSTMNEVINAIDVLKKAGSRKSDITILQCTTEYPTPMKDVNLNAMLAMQKELDVKVGYSDHTKGIEVPIAAVAMGATIIEKHFTLDCSMEGPDHAASLEPLELKQMVSSIRNIEKALGSGLKEPSPSEKKNLLASRRSIVASKDINKDDLLTEANLAVKRPSDGICASLYFNVIGKKAIKDYKSGEHIIL